VLVAGLIAAALVNASGCRATRTLAQREIVVHFNFDTPLPERATVARTCAALPTVSPEPLPVSMSSAQAKLNELRFRVDKANNARVEALIHCAQGFSSVRYIDTPDSQ
jgi:hypothetical protein